MGVDRILSSGSQARIAMWQWAKLQVPALHPTAVAHGQQYDRTEVVTAKNHCCLSMFSQSQQELMMVSLFLLSKVGFCKLFVMYHEYIKGNILHKGCSESALPATTL